MSKFYWCNFELCCCRSASICLGDLHPDNVLSEEQSLKAAKKTYYSFLENYHTEYVVLVNFPDYFLTFFRPIISPPLPFLGLSYFLTFASMIENLQMWKDKWSGCKDPEVDFMQNIWRLLFFSSNCMSSHIFLKWSCVFLKLYVGLGNA